MQLFTMNKTFCSLLSTYRSTKVKRSCVDCFLKCKDCVFVSRFSTTRKIPSRTEDLHTSIGGAEDTVTGAASRSSWLNTHAKPERTVREPCRYRCLSQNAVDAHRRLPVCPVKGAGCGLLLEKYGRYRASTIAWPTLISPWTPSTHRPWVEAVGPRCETPLAQF